VAQPVDLTKLAFDYSVLRKPGVAVGGGALLGAGLGAGIGALTADPEEGDSRWGRAGIGAMAGGAVGAGAGVAAADWGNFNPYARPPKPRRTAPVATPATPPTNAPSTTIDNSSPESRISQPMNWDMDQLTGGLHPSMFNDQGETHQTFSLGRFKDYRFNPNQAYSINHMGTPDVVRFVGMHPESDYAIPQFESLTRSGVGRKRGEALRFYVADPADVQGPMFRLQPHTEVSAGMSSDPNHPALNYLRTGDASQLQPIRTQAKMGSAPDIEFWATEYTKLSSLLVRRRVPMMVSRGSADLPNACEGSAITPTTTGVD
jgi:hypothetical protein